MRTRSLQGKAYGSIVTVSKAVIQSLSIAKLLSQFSFYLILLIIFFATSILRAQTINATQKDALIIDNGASGKADQNDRIRYDVTIQNTGAASATGTQLNIVPDPRTTLAPGSFRSSPLALNDTYTCTGNVGINVPAASGVKSNDFDDNLAGTTLAITTTPTNGTASINNDGSFTYAPNAGFTGTDNFSYTMTDGNGVGAPVPNTDVATVTITVSNMIWFIDNTGGGSGGTGTLASPFKLISNFNAASGPDVNQLVFIKNTGTNYVGPLNLENGQLLFGTGHTGGSNLADVVPFVLAPNSNTLPAINGTRPVIQNNSGDGINVATDNTVRGLNVGDAGGLAIRNTGTTSAGNLIINDLSIINTIGGGFSAANGSTASMSLTFTTLTAAGGNGMKLINCLGLVAVNGGSITGGTALVITGGTVTYSSSGVILGTTGFAVDIDNHDSNNITQSGNVSSTGSGIRVQNCGGGTISFSGASKSLNTGANTAVTLASNSGATITFSGGGLVVNTTSGGGFNATGGATAVNITGTGNTIISTTGIALNVNATTIGVGGLNFLSISAGTSAGGPIKGISLNNTGSGGLTITGTGSTNGSGGNIQDAAAGSSTQRGIEIINAQNISLSNMTLNNACRVQGAQSVGTFGGNENTDENGSIYLQNAVNVNLNNIDINGSVQHGINGNVVTNLDINNSEIQNTGDAVWESGIYLFNLRGTASSSLDNNFSNLNIHDTGQFNIWVQNNAATNTSGNPTTYGAVNRSNMDALTINNVTFSKSGNFVIGDHVSVFNSGTSNFRTIVTNSSFTSHVGTGVGGDYAGAHTSDGIQVDAGENAYSDFEISGCSFANAGQAGINISAALNGFGTFNVHDNANVLVRQGSGINLASTSSGSATLRGFISNNTFSTNISNNPSMGIQAVLEGNGKIVADINNNTVVNNGLNSFAYGIRAGARAGSGAADFKINNNSGFGEDAGVWFFAGNGSGGETSRTTVNFTGNNIDGGPTSFADYFVEMYTGTTFQIQGFAGSGTNAGQVASYIASTDDDAGAMVEAGLGTIVNYSNGTVVAP